MKLLHGSKQIIEKPLLSAGKRTNDYGQGFYCTKEENLAGEWACRDNEDGFINYYEINLCGLNELNLMNGNYTVLNWIALLLKNRTFNITNTIALDARDYLIAHFAVDTSGIDLITGYRADDSYFSFAESFIENALPLSSLAKALYLGKLGLQTALVSQKAFDKLVFEKAKIAKKIDYYKQFLRRDSSARETFKNDLKNLKNYRNDIFVMDILREEIKNDDERIPRIISI